MKLITMTMLLVTALGCWFPTQVRAEAPQPRGGCVSRDIVMRPNTDPQAMTTVKGRVVAIEHGNNQRIAAKEIVTWLRVKTINGDEKLIYLGSDRSLNQRHLKIQVGDSIEIKGIQMPNAKQLATIVASIVKKGDRVIKINNFNDKPTGTKLCKYNG
jgi:hypothetical protein